MSCGVLFKSCDRTSSDNVNLKRFAPLHCVAFNGHTDLTKTLLEAGASLFSMDELVIKPSVKLSQ